MRGRDPLSEEGQLERFCLQEEVANWMVELQSLEILHLAQQRQTWTEVLSYKGRNVQTFVNRKRSCQGLMSSEIPSVLCLWYFSFEEPIFWQEKVESKQRTVVVFKEL